MCPRGDRRGRRAICIEPGSSTAAPANVTYRLEKLHARGIIRGAWLDCGCADGTYTRALLDYGADRVVGLDVIEQRVAEARAATPPGLAVEYLHGQSEGLPFADETFDGVLLNEVLEHVADEQRTLDEVRRVLRPGGHLALFSPNRWFPFEGHGLRLGSRSFDHPAPLVPWLPAVLTAPILRARNYWPNELESLVRDAGFRIIHSGSAFPVFEFYPWLPAAIIPGYRRAVPLLERLPVINRFGVSTLVLAQRPGRS